MDSVYPQTPLSGYIQTPQTLFVSLNTMNVHRIFSSLHACKVPLSIHPSNCTLMIYGSCLIPCSLSYDILNTDETLKATVVESNVHNPCDTMIRLQLPFSFTFHFSCISPFFFFNFCLLTFFISFHFFLTIFPLLVGSRFETRYFLSFYLLFHMSFDLEILEQGR